MEIFFESADFFMSNHGNRRWQKKRERTKKRKHKKPCKFFLSSNKERFQLLCIVDALNIFLHKAVELVKVGKIFKTGSNKSGIKKLILSEKEMKKM